jgi:hypothetical protein
MIPVERSNSITFRIWQRQCTVDVQPATDPAFGGEGNEAYAHRSVSGAR